MIPLFFTIFFSVVLPQDQLICQNRDSFIEEDLYKEMLFSSNDFKVKRKYLQKFGHCMTSEGISFTEIKNIPVIEILDCSSPLKRNGSEVFFSEGKLCSRFVSFFPSRKVFTINENKKIFINNGSLWKTLENGGVILFYHSETVFTENTDPAGRELKKNDSSNYVDKLGRPAYPQFVYESGIWRQVSPLKELFELKINDDKSFEIKMITESPISYEPAKLVQTTGLKAGTVNIETPVPNNYLITGKEIKGVRIPKLFSTGSSESCHGTYIIRLSFPGIAKKKPIRISEKSYEITIDYSDTGMEFVLAVSRLILSKQDLTKIKAVINREIPSFYIDHENNNE